VGEATNATGLPTAARRSTQRFGDLTFGISLVVRLWTKTTEFFVCLLLLALYKGIFPQETVLKYSAFI
jgi:hypothetical protein